MGVSSSLESYKMPTFQTQKEFQASPWAKYIDQVYKSQPSNFPLNLNYFQILYQDILNDVGIDISKYIPAKRTCPTRENQLFTDMSGTWDPPNTVWLTKLPPYNPANDNTWVEVTHSGYGKSSIARDDIGNWMYITPGSGIFFYTGKTKVFKDHPEAVLYFLGEDCTPDYSEILTSVTITGLTACLLTFAIVAVFLRILDRSATHPRPNNAVFVILVILIVLSTPLFIFTYWDVFLSTSPRRGAVSLKNELMYSECTEQFTRLFTAAKQKGYNSLQFLAHGDQRCGLSAVEIVDVYGNSNYVCGDQSPNSAEWKKRYRTGWNHSLECTCQYDKAQPDLGFLNCSGTKN